MKMPRVFVVLLLMSLAFGARVEICLAQSVAASAVNQNAATNSRQGKKATPAADALRKYAGRYELEVGIIPVSTLDVTVENGELWIKPSAVKKRRLIHQSKSVFVDEVGGARYVFQRDDEGRVVALTFPFEGESYTARKVELPAPNLTGNAVFRLKGYADANVVALAGSFNNWNQSEIICAREPEEWVCRVDLKAGIYTYKFIVDGNWVLDPSNPNTVEDEAGNVNSMTEVKEN